MNILVVSATEFEVTSLKNLNLKNLDFAITGIGMLSTLWGLQTALLSQKYDLVINLGIAGSFTKKIKIGDVVQVTKETIGDLGFEDKKSFIPISNSKLADEHHYTFSNPYSNKFLDKYNPVSSISVNTCSGQLKTIAERKTIFNPDIENMEGAAIFMFCIKSKVPFVELRAISNDIEERDTSKWDIPLAVKNLNKEALEFINFIKQ